MSRRLAVVIAVAGALLVVIVVGTVGAYLGASYLVNLSSSPRATPYAVPTPNEVEAFGLRLDRAYHAGSGAATPLFDVRAMALRVMPEGLDGPTQSGLVRGIEQGFNTRGLVPLVGTELSRGATYGFRGLAKRDGRPVARFRLLSSSGGVGFHDYVVGRSGQGELRILDVFLLNSGEYLSQTLGALLASALPDQDLVARLLGERNELARDLPKLSQLRELVEAGEMERALALYDTLSEPARRDRTFFLLRVRAASELGDDARYLAVLDELEATFPNDPAANANLLDAYFLRRDWSSCQRALDALSAEFPDPYWDALRGRVFLGAGNLEAARAAGEHVVASEPDLILGHDVVLAASLASGDLARANQALQLLIARFGVDPVALAAQPGYQRVTELPAARGPADAAPPADAR